MPFVDRRDARRRLGRHFAGRDLDRAVVVGLARRGAGGCLQGVVAAGSGVRVTSRSFGRRFAQIGRLSGETRQDQGLCELRYEA